MTFQTMTPSADEYGGPVEGFSDFVTLLCDIEPMSGREHYAARFVNSNAEFKITTYFYPGISTTSRILFGSRVFDVLGAINTDERNREMVIVAKEVF